MSHVLSREMLLARTGRRFKDVEFAELRGSVRLASMTGADLFRHRKIAKRRAEGEDVEEEFVRFLLASAMVDGENKPICDEATAGELVSALGIDVINKIVDQIQELNNPDPKKTEEPPKGNSATNSGTTPTEG